ncbi:21058_t:CDS:1, partial [Racocetra persica]
KMGKDNIHLTFLVIPTGAFFGYRSMPNGISISKNESVDALRTRIWDYYFNEYGNISFNLRVVNIKRREYVRIEPEKKNSNYFDKSPIGISIHILVEV